MSYAGGAAQHADAYGEVSASFSGGAIITAAGSADTKGSYVELVASTPFDASGMLVAVGPQPAANWGNEGLIDIAVGAATEEVLIPNLVESGSFWSGSHNTGQGGYHYFPVAIPAGTRIAARWQSNVANAPTAVVVYLFQGGNLFGPGFQRVEACGVQPGTNSLASEIDPGGTANAKGAVKELIASTAFDYHALHIAFTSLGQATASSKTWLVDLQIGASTEQVIIPNLFFGSGTGGVFGHGYPVLAVTVPFYIPQGTRISAKCQSNDNTSGTRKIGLAVYGIG